MLELRELPELDGSVEGIFGHESIIKDFIKKFEGNNIDGMIKQEILAILQKFLVMSDE